MKPEDKLIVALDVDTEAKALVIAEKLKNNVRFFKIGLELFSACGPEALHAIKKTGARIFLDLKFHDIPNTVAKASRAVTRLGVEIFNIHAMGGYEMMKASADAARDEAQKLNIERPMVIAVTVLTSMDEMGLKRVGVNDKIETEALRLAALAKEAGLDGVVASPLEAKLIRKKLGEKFLIVTPGVRPYSSSAGDQKRIATPKQAIASGADMIVVGRPITEAEDMVFAARQILKGISS